MTNATPPKTRRLLSRISPDGELHAWIEEVEVPPPGPGEAVVRMEAAPIHSSDMNMMFGPADFARATASGPAEAPELRAPLLPGGLESQKLRLGDLIEPGAEGAGVVIATGEGAERLMGKRVAVWGRSTYREVQVFDSAQCLELPDEASLEDGAAAFVNPLTALGLLRTAQAEGHKAIINTAAGSNIGRMLIELCRREGVALVNIVRRPALARELRELGAEHVVDSSAPDAEAQLVAAIGTTGARICFDAVGGPLTGWILGAIETSARQEMTEYSGYGSREPRRCFIYGALDPSPIQIPRAAGLAWTCGGWLLPPYLAALGPEEKEDLFASVREGLGTVFKGGFARRIDLAEALRPETIRAFAARSTDSKTLIRF